jgi:lipopolysaccharide/colanic/teichoic acid biosynthesis glycosyltransferase
MLFPAPRAKTGLWRRIFGRAARPFASQILSVSSFQAAFDRERALAIRSHRTFMLVVLVPAADPWDCLETAAEIVKARLRESDLVGNLDQDRLGLILPETDESGAQSVIESLLVDLARANLNFNYRSFQFPLRKASDVDSTSASRPSTNGTHGTNGNGVNGAKRNGSNLEGTDNHETSRGHNPGGSMTVNGRRDAGLAGHETGWPLPHALGSNGGVTVLNRRGIRSRVGPVEALKASTVAMPESSHSHEGVAPPTIAEIRQFVGRPPASDLQPQLERPISYPRRASDVLFSASLLCTLSPLLLLVAALVKATSPGPVIFRQQRAGQGGRPFSFYKFRSMYLDAEERRVALEAQNEKEGPIFKIKQDPRITPIGRILRRTSIDELPQLFNVLRGDMTLIGPRPPRMDEIEHYEPWQRQRLELKGGLTCIWQVSGRSEIQFVDWVRMDLQYARRRSTWFDISLLARTVYAVLSGRGAY